MPGAASTAIGRSGRRVTLPVIAAYLSFPIVTVCVVYIGGGGGGGGGGRI